LYINAVFIKKTKSMRPAAITLVYAGASGALGAAVVVACEMVAGGRPTGKQRCSADSFY
jgi:hypothetical protein